MRNKKAKKIRKDIGYDLKKERQEGRKVFSVTHKTLKDKEGNPKYLGIVCDEQRRLYQLIKKITS